MAGKQLLESYTPKMIYAGDFPIVTDTGIVDTGEVISAFSPVVLGSDGKIKVATKDTIEDVYGLAVEDAIEEETVAIHLTGQFFGEALVLPEGTTASDFKVAFRKLNIFLVDTENTVKTEEETE